MLINAYAIYSKKNRKKCLIFKEMMRCYIILHYIKLPNV